MLHAALVGWMDMPPLPASQPGFFSKWSSPTQTPRLLALSPVISMECWELDHRELSWPELACAFATPREHSELKWKPRRCLQIEPDQGPTELRTLLWLCST